MSIQEAPTPLRDNGPVRGNLPPKSFTNKGHSDIPVPSYMNPNVGKKEKSAAGVPDKNVVPVVKAGDVVTPKKPLAKRFKETFIQESLKTAALYLLADRVIPGIKVGALNLLEMMFFGTASRGGGRSGGKTDYTGYSGGYRNSRNEPRETERERLEREREERYRRANHDFDGIVYTSLDVAGRVLDTLREMIDIYGKVYVAEFYKLSDREAEYTDYSYGWEDLRDVPAPHRVKDGWILLLPKPHVIK